MAFGIGRRQFISALGGTAFAWPLAARAQQAALPVVGVLSSTSPDATADLLAAFHQGLKETGYIEHQNVTMQTDNTVVCRRSRPNWFTHKWE